MFIYILDYENDNVFRVDRKNDTDTSAETIIKRLGLDPDMCHWMETRVFLEETLVPPISPEEINEMTRWSEKIMKGCNGKVIDYSLNPNDRVFTLTIEFQKEN
tara:strand:+ start:1120 stop:1428 length:309 start_codon:yes stop_codon:yes gene_type:complete